MGISFVRAFSTPKLEDTPNEDRYAVSLDRTICAISDGASVAFDSGPWAEILVKGFVDGASLSREWLTRAAGEYEALYDRDELDWMQQGALDRGSFASLLGVRPSSNDQAIDVIVVGDTMLAVLETGELRLTMPYTHPEQFNVSPQLISTHAIENEPLFEEGREVTVQTIDLSPYMMPLVLLVSDALGHWMLSHRERAHEVVAKVTQEEFDAFVAVEREAGRMRRDDTTLLIMDCNVASLSH